MKKFLSLVYTFLILNLMSITAFAAPAAKISYTVTFPEAQAHYVDIEMKLSGLAQKTTNLKMPVWTPGSYLVREFAKNVEGFTAWNGSKAIEAGKVNKNTWRINTTGITELTVKYRVYANEVSVRTAFIDASHAFLSTSGLFLYPQGMLSQPSTIKIVPYKGWTTVSTSLEQVGGDQFTVTAPNYDILFDSPIEVGTQDVFNFKAAGVNYEVAMYGGGNYDKERLKVDMPKVIEQHTKIFGENPNKRYVFIVHNFQRGGGGLEHLSSTVLGASRDGYATERGYLGFLELVSHEHFHLWNVKRLRPIALGPFDYENENYTTNLWIAEGFTAYYEAKAMRHAGLLPADGYVNTLAGSLSNHDNQPGSKIQSAAEASFDAWIKFYRPNENSNNSTISYYGKGSIIAYMLDLEIINSSNAKYSLDDVMKYMYNEYYKVKKRGYTDAEFKLGLEKFAGKKLDDFYKKYITGVEFPDNATYFGYAGYKVTDELAGTDVPALGIATSSGGGRLVVTAVSRASSAWVDGINVNDEITAVDGSPVTDAAAIVNGKKVGDKINVTITRDGKQLILPVTLLKSTRVKYKIEPADNATEKQLAVRKKWLNL
ncbi:M61 family metallopeptidase [Mucilaginibacter sp. JRF]|uniref:M61 family metallopeptidase n=1 Tax=Mucilaginibacter sp. JRF TaxID=2780088 RepID=UPI00188010D3|nr:PDZ domain-containing protein [Mucilaginibacter sp. JRF]MBE9584828.1 M61 family metallopeptidase [Mucilaginibacter sp. JRF]